MKKLLNNLLNLAIVATIVFGAVISIDTIKDIKSSNKQYEEYMAQANIPQHKNYNQYGRYNDNHAWEDDRGYVWRYETNDVSGLEVYENMPVILFFDDNATPESIYDDKIIGIMYDVETAIYDDLEESLSTKFDLERTGNNIHINNIKEEK